MYEEYCFQREEFKKEIGELKTEVENSRMYRERKMIEELLEIAELLTLL